MASGKIASKVTGVGKSAMKALEGYPGIFHHLAGEHAEVASLMKRVSGSRDVETRESVFAEIRRDLLAHAKGEEAEFYPPLRQFAELAAMIDQSLREHEDIERLVEQLETEQASSPQWSDAFERLVQAVESHVEHEENLLFPKANALLESAQAREMEDRYERVEQQEKERL